MNTKLVTSPRRAVLVGLLAAGSAVVTSRRAAAAGSFANFLEAIEAEAVGQGLHRETIARTLTGIRYSARVVDLDEHQPEFTLTWSEYAQRVLPQERLEQARDMSVVHRDVLAQVTARYAVDPGVIIGIWGLESSFGQRQGGFNVCDALATLAFHGRRASFFRSELLKALTMVDLLSIEAAEMMGSYAGAMGQPQFMPSAYLHFARAFDGSRRADIWHHEPDVFASIASYLSACGWRKGEPWGQAVVVEASAASNSIAHGQSRPLDEWFALGVRRADGRAFSRGDVVGTLLLPDGDRHSAFLVYDNFKVIRRYNPSDFYAIAVGLLGNQVA